MWKMFLSSDATQTIDTSELAEGIDLSKFGLSSIQNWFAQNSQGIVNFIVKIIIAIIIILIAIRVIRFVRKLFRKAMEKAGFEKGVIQFLDSTIKIILYIILFLAVINQFGVQTTSIVAILGSAGLTIGLALQGSLSNFAGGVLILVLKPFKVGDYIVEDTHGNEGFVKEITIFYTKLTTVDHRTVVVPNGTLANTSLTNVTHQDERQLDLSVGISYNADLRYAKEVIKEVAEGIEGRIKEKEVVIFVKELAASSVDIGIRVWIPADDYWTIRWQLLEDIKLALDDHNIDIPYQQVDVTIKQ
ncbi:mechanosensitive ion channel family protein [Eubacterium oxidoreducens]|uniref:Small conductance mechanosensitive channel n=1 Tax=Eubacterium oxidoreducens TaxID=1732 RepID=A0A1G6AXS6_EUBOX|nr:mechanosensitive ion channel domain-containing protein [Eubacterium oxidoreducens]SDB13211.1 small conductance mechanosensitive channel [Eubacterium oxidoreducens]